MQANEKDCLSEWTRRTDGSDTTLGHVAPKDGAAAKSEGGWMDAVGGGGSTSGAGDCSAPAMRRSGLKSPVAAGFVRHRFASKSLRAHPPTARRASGPMGATTALSCWQFEPIARCSGGGRYSSRRSSRTQGGRGPRPYQTGKPPGLIRGGLGNSLSHGPRRGVSAASLRPPVSQSTQLEDAAQDLVTPSGCQSGYSTARARGEASRRQWREVRH
jgi:hypothetical protein